MYVIKYASVNGSANIFDRKIEIEFVPTKQGHINEPTFLNLIDIPFLNRFLLRL